MKLKHDETLSDVAFNHNVLRPYALGTVEVDVGEFLDGELHNKWVKLTAIESGEVRLRVQYFAGAMVAPKTGWDVERRIDAEEAAELEKASWARSGAQHVNLSCAVAANVPAREGFLLLTLNSGTVAHIIPATSSNSF